MPPPSTPRSSPQGLGSLSFTCSQHLSAQTGSTLASSKHGEHVDDAHMLHGRVIESTFEFRGARSIQVPPRADLPSPRSLEIPPVSTNKEERCVEPCRLVSDNVVSLHDGYRPERIDKISRGIG
ncbi:hypothetical protein FZEAL_3388 [Fusarium zealandicum]|uniref:Uncharacterized protein n=1 Tax=Fusarium zealandicum TaxID=1053134 RepID=A0A8H4UNV2_9HYPO|nr:hypothetical protein FZEAL_3388 [Fusarium zealandicum]